MQLHHPMYQNMSNGSLDAYDFFYLQESNEIKQFLSQKQTGLESNIYISIIINRKENFSHNTLT